MEAKDNQIDLEILKSLFWEYDWTSVKECINLFKAKYGEYNPLVISKAMTYFTDADTEPELKMLKPISWQDIKKFFIETFTEI